MCFGKSPPAAFQTAQRKHQKPALLWGGGTMSILRYLSLFDRDSTSYPSHVLKNQPDKEYSIPIADASISACKW